MNSSQMPRSEPRVALFHESLIWPLQLEPLNSGEEGGRHWEVFEALRGHEWQLIDDEFTADPALFQERHYREFVSFLPYVQRFLYGDGSKVSPMHVFRRQDIVRLRLSLDADAPPLELRVVHLDLYFFHDLDVVMLNVEVHGDDLSLRTVRDILFRFGRAYPAGWDESGTGLHNVQRAEWLAADGAVVAVSDSERRDKYLGYVCRNRMPCISEHWACLLRPLVLSHAVEAGVLRYRLIEYHRMPLMAYLAIEQPRALTREDWLRLGLAATLHPDEALPLRDPAVIDFEARYCQDRYWNDGVNGPSTRHIVTGNAFTVVGDAASDFFLDADRGVLAQFRHQHFVLFLIAHLHRAALLVFSDVLMRAVNDLDIRNDASVRRFKRRIRANFETFLRFTHRYWFHELSERPHVQALFRLCSDHLRNDALYAEVRDEIREMSQYLDSDSQRRQSNTVVRLTVVTILGLIGTVSTGYFGMNLMALAEQPLGERLAYFTVVLLASSAMVFFAVTHSKRLSDVLETMSDERLGLRARLAALARAWRRGEAD